MAPPCLSVPSLVVGCILDDSGHSSQGPQGTVARVHIGQVIMSIRTKLQNKEHVIEALRRAKFKFPGHQKIHISKKWGFTKFNADEFEDMVAEKRLIPDGCGVKYIPNSGPLDKWRALHS
nr:60S ribosomal protein L10-like [Nyctereutes procyonoides]